MKKEELIKFLPEAEKIPIGALTWDSHQSWTISTATAKMISVKHNTDCYPIQVLPKPIGRIIDFTINNTLEPNQNGSH